MSDTPPPPAPSGGLPPALGNLSPATLNWTQVGGGLAVVIFTFLPWITISFGVFGSASGNLWRWDAGFAVLLLLLGLAVAGLALIKVLGIQVQGLENLPPVTPLVLASALLVFVVIEWLRVIEAAGVGAWLSLIAALVTFGAALLPVLKARQS